VAHEHRHGAALHNLLCNRSSEQIHLSKRRGNG
jgi:hypothetical protein